MSSDRRRPGLQTTVVGNSIERRVLGKLRDAWGRWRESRRQYQLERALYKAGGGSTGAFATMEHTEGIQLASGADLPRVEAPKGKAPDPRAARDDD
jgi:hypothetical protein